MVQLRPATTVNGLWQSRAAGLQGEGQSTGPSAHLLLGRRSDGCSHGPIFAVDMARQKILCVTFTGWMGERHAIERSRLFWSVQARSCKGTVSAGLGRLRASRRSALSHGYLRACDACQESQPRDARRACGVSMHRCAKTSSPRRTARIAPFACGRCVWYLRDV